MKAWVKGDQSLASRVDPTIGAIVAAVVDIFVSFDLHTKLGMGEDQLLQIGLHIAVLVLALRSLQLNAKGRRKKLDPGTEDAVPAGGDPPSS